MVAAGSAWYASSWLYDLREGNTVADGWNRLIPWTFAQALLRLKPSLGNRLLDVGCAEGQFLYLAKQVGFEVIGVDFNPTGLEIAKRLLGISTVYPYSVEELADRFADAPYDVVTMFEVLEHTADPFQTVCSLKKVMKPGGQLLLSVPGSGRWPALFHPRGRCAAAPPYAVDPGILAEDP